MCEQRKHGSVGAGAGNRPGYLTAAIDARARGRRGLVGRQRCALPSAVRAQEEWMARFSHAQVPEAVQPFWAALQAGEFIADAAVRAGTYRKQGTRWVAACGGVRPRRGRNLRGRCLPLAEREVRLGQSRRGYLPVVILLVAVGLVAFGLVPIAIAFFAAAVSLLLFRVLSVREAYEIVEWPILVLIGA
ncbi:MAG: SLC13 family permease, partial [Burkholderiales bacterium]